MIPTMLLQSYHEYWSLIHQLKKLLIGLTEKTYTSKGGKVNLAKLEFVKMDEGANESGGLVIWIFQLHFDFGRCNDLLMNCSDRSASRVGGK